MKPILYFILSVIITSCKSESNTKSTAANDQMGHQIMQFEDDLNFITHTFPDSLSGGDTLKAEIYSETDEWKIIEAYANCSIENSGIFKPKHRTQLECLSLFVDENRVLIEFVTIGKGPKIFDKVTLVMVNDEGIQKAAEMDFTYYLK